MGDGQLAAADFFGVGIDDQGLGILYEPALDGTALLFELVLQDGDVPALNDEFLPAALEDILGMFVLGEDRSCA